MLCLTGWPAATTICWRGRNNSQIFGGINCLVIFCQIGRREISGNRVRGLHLEHEELVGIAVLRIVQACQIAKEACSLQVQTAFVTILLHNPFPPYSPPPFLVSSKDTSLKAMRVRRYIWLQIDVLTRGKVATGYPS